MVYRPLGNPENFLRKTVKYKFGATAPMIKRKTYNRRRQVDTFDSISYKAFFSEYNWDKTDRKIHRFVRIKKLSRFYKMKWLPDTQVYVRGMLERRKKKFVLYFADLMMKLLIQDMVYRGNRIIFQASDSSGHVKGWYKIGAFKDEGILMNFERLILSIVPHKEEMVGSYYPIIYPGYGSLRLFKKAWSEKKIAYESINLQERIAANNRLSGLYRRVFKSPKNKKAYLQGGNRIKSGNIYDHKNHSSS